MLNQRVALKKRQKSTKRDQPASGNGSSKKKLRSEDGKQEIDVARDRLVRSWHARVTATKQATHISR
jgi:hypothetical protein